MWFPSLRTQYRALSWGSSHSRTHFLQGREKAGSQQRRLATSEPAAGMGTRETQLLAPAYVPCPRLAYRVLARRSQ